MVVGPRVRPEDWGTGPNRQSRDRDNSVMVESITSRGAEQRETCIENNGNFLLEGKYSHYGKGKAREDYAIRVCLEMVAGMS